MTQLGRWIYNQSSRIGEAGCNKQRRQPMPVWRSRKIKVEVEFAVDGSESDGTAVDLILDQLAGIQTIRKTNPDLGIVLTISKPEVRSTFIR